MDDRHPAPTWSFRRLRREGFDQLRTWLTDPGVARWWHHEVSEKALERDFGPSIDRREPSEDLLVLGDCVPAGLVQRCRLADYPEYRTQLAALTLLSPQAWTVDYLLGVSHRGRGWATAMLGAAIADLRAAHADAAEIVVPVVAGNQASWRLLEATGFERVAEGDLEPDNPIDPPLHYLYRIAAGSCPDRPPTETRRAARADQSGEPGLPP